MNDMNNNDSGHSISSEEKKTTSDSNDKNSLINNFFYNSKQSLLKQNTKISKYNIRQPITTNQNVKKKLQLLIENQKLIKQNEILTAKNQILEQNNSILQAQINNLETYISAMQEKYNQLQNDIEKSEIPKKKDVILKIKQVKELPNSFLRQLSQEKNYKNDILNKNSNTIFKSKLLQVKNPLLKYGFK